MQFVLKLFSKSKVLLPKAVLEVTKAEFEAKMFDGHTKVCSPSFVTAMPNISLASAHVSHQESVRQDARRVNVAGNL